MVKPGNKNSREVLFEEIEELQEGDKTFSFMTNSENMALWIDTLDKIYQTPSSKTTDITWSYTKAQEKVMAQIREKIINKETKTTRNRNINASFFLTTHRVLFQGNGCREWYSENFTNLKDSVYKRKESEHLKTEETVLRLTETFSDDELESGKAVQVSDGALPPQNDNEITQPDLPQTPKSNISTPRTRRQLPQSPLVLGSPNILNSLKIGMDKLMKENVDLKANLHHINSVNDQLQSENESLKSQLNDLRNEIKNIHVKLDKEIDYSQETANLEQAIRNCKSFLNTKSATEKLKCDLDNLFTRMRTEEDNTEQQNEKYNNLANFIKDLEGNITLYGNKLKDLEDAMNNVQEDLFDTSNVDTVSINTNRTGNSDRINKVTNQKIFRDFKRNSYNTTILFGDSNTKYLDRRKLKTDITSLPGATIESATKYFCQSADKVDSSVKCVIFHLGTNNLSVDSTEEIKDKFSKLHTAANKKYPNAKLSVCQIPIRKNIDDSIVRELNDFLKNQQDNFDFIQIWTDKKHFCGDGIHYNDHGIAIVASNIKRWAVGKGFIYFNKGFPHNVTQNREYYPNIQQRYNTTTPPPQNNHDWQEWMRKNYVNQWQMQNINAVQGNRNHNPNQGFNPFNNGLYIQR